MVEFLIKFDTSIRNLKHSVWHLIWSQFRIAFTNWVCIGIYCASTSFNQVNWLFTSTHFNLFKCPFSYKSNSSLRAFGLMLLSNSFRGCKRWLRWAIKCKLDQPKSDNRLNSQNVHFKSATVVRDCYVNGGHLCLPATSPYGQINEVKVNGNTDSQLIKQVNSIRMPLCTQSVRIKDVHGSGLLIW